MTQPGTITPLRKEWHWPAAMVVVMLIALAVFYWDYTRTADIGDREVIGFVTYKNNRVQRKLYDRAMWSAMQNNSPLTNRDTIRSEDLSDAVIHLNDGTIIKIDENSMFFLDLSGDSPKLNFTNGSIQVEQDENGESSLVIQTGDRTINVSGADLKLEGGGETEDGSWNPLSLIMQSGEAKIRGEDGTQTVGADQQARLGADGVQVREVTMKLLEPANQAVVPLDGGGSKRLAFRWKLREPYSNLTFEISRDRSFNRGVNREDASPGGAVATVSSGNYYWRIRGTNRSTGKAETSEVRKLSVVANARVRLFAPAPGSQISYVVQPPLVSFSWSANNLANGYDLEIADNSSFTGDVRKYSVGSTSFAVQDLAAGTYYWRVRTKSAMAGVPARTTAASAFRIVQRDGFAAPSLESPRSGQTVPVASAGDTVLLSWRASREISRYEVEVSQDSSFTTSVTTQRADRNYLNYKAPKTGTFYWRVKGYAADGKATPYSPVQRFAVTSQDESLIAGKDEELAAADTAAKEQQAQRERAERERAERERAEREERERPNTFAAVAPVNSTVDVTKVKSIRFHWKPSRGARSYTLRLYRGGQGARKLVLEKTVRGTEYTLTDFSVLDIGTFTWILTDTPGGQVIESRFQIAADTLDNLRPEDIEFISPETIYKE